MKKKVLLLNIFLILLLISKIPLSGRDDDSNKTISVMEEKKEIETFPISDSEEDILEETNFKN